MVKSLLKLKKWKKNCQNSKMAIKATWFPSDAILKKSNIYSMMARHHIESYTDFWKWSVVNKEQFWEETVANLNIQYATKYSKIVDVSEGVENAKWLFGAKINIVDSCFQNDGNSTVIKYQNPGESIQEISQDQLLNLVNRIANSLTESGLKKGDAIAIDMPMTLKAVAIYLAGIKAGLKVATIADSFTSKEIEVRLKITQPKLVFTQDVLQRGGKKLPLYDKVVKAKAAKIVVISNTQSEIQLREIDVYWNDFLSKNNQFDSVKLDPEETTTILFSSGTTGEPKAIPWNHTTPIKSASDGYYHQDIHQNDVVCWPTNLGWMMGPWLVFAALINKASIALYYDAPLTSDFGSFVQNAKVTMLGVIPSIVKHWKNTVCMESSDWNTIKCFSSTGEVSNPEEMEYLMNLAGNKPVIEYCGGTEIGGGYIASTVVQPNIPSVFSSQTLGGDFVLLDENGEESDKGELFLIPPIMGLSTQLLNKNHHQVYYENTPNFSSKLRRHGDELMGLDPDIHQGLCGYFQMLGRVDDAMNLGGIKVSSAQIESVINKLTFVKESAAIAVSPKGGGPSELIVFYVENELDSTSNEELKEVQKSIRTNLNPLFKVVDLVKIGVLPRTASNKVMRRSLREIYKN